LSGNLEETENSAHFDQGICTEHISRLTLALFTATAGRHGLPAGNGWENARHTAQGRASSELKHPTKAVLRTLHRAKEKKQTSGWSEGKMGTNWDATSRRAKNALADRTRFNTPRRTWDGGASVRRHQRLRTARAHCYAGEPGDLRGERGPTWAKGFQNLSARHRRANALRVPLNSTPLTS